MIELQSEMVGQVRDLIHTKNELERLDFTYGGNWDYDRGTFDKFLNEERTVWLRIPFEVVQGEMDAEVVDTEARIRFGQPFVFKHLYREGLDPEAGAGMGAFGGLVDQFQAPTDPDADVERHWVSKAQTLLDEAERVLHE